MCCGGRFLTAAARSGHRRSRCRSCWFGWRGTRQGHARTDRLVTVTGFTLKAEGRTDLARVVIICCAADASLARIRLSGPAAPHIAAYPEDTWVRVEAKVPPGQTFSRDGPIAVMEVFSAERIDPPANLYEY